VIAPALRKIAERLTALADEIDAGHVIASDDIRIEVRRLAAQAEMMDECE
jgi:hypothetical protein